MSVIDELEPHPPAKGEIYEKGSYKWLERYEYIDARTERYYDYYRESIEYDFTKAGHFVQREQAALLVAYQAFASGTLLLLGVRSHAENLLKAFKRKIATPLTEEEKAEAVKKAEYVPEWKRKHEAKREQERHLMRARELARQPTPDKTSYITSRAYRGSFDVSPMRGYTCYSLDQNEGFYTDGRKTTKGMAYSKILWEVDAEYSKLKVDKTPAIFLPLEEQAELARLAAPVTKVDTDTLKTEAARVLNETRLSKRTRGK